MKSNSILQTAFDNIAPHISNLEDMKELIVEIDDQHLSVEDITKLLEDRLDTSEVTFRTDLRILLNEIRHMMSKESL